MSRLPIYAFAALLLSIVAILIIPLPPWLLDTLLGVDIFGAALVLLLSVTVENPLEFSAFAPALLIATLFRLALDVSATRVILTHGAEPGGVGAIIPAFGQFVVQNNLVVGLIVFVILVTIQFVVIATGSQRVAEVAARFTLDAMPGKQMAIEADVHAGLLDADGARRKREAVQKEADFFGAMDGAGKFVKGDAIAALVIVVLNLLGGIVVGTVYHAMSPADALSTFALLSIGNALVTTLPAFLISIAMGMMVTRVAGDGSLGADLAAQLFARPEILRSAGALLLVLAFVPALPRPVFLALGAAAFAAAQAAHVRRTRRRDADAALREHVKRRAVRRPETAIALVGVDAVSIEFGADLAPLLASPNADALLDRIGEVRRALAAEIGLVLPGVRLRDDLHREPATYAIRVRDTLAAQGHLRVDRVLAVGDEATLARIAGEDGRDPVFDLAAKWIDPSAQSAARGAGALVFDPISILGSHLAEVTRAHAPALLGRQELHTLLEHLRASVPSVVKEIGGETLPLAAVHKAFALLLRERAWPRDPIAVLEAMIDARTGEPRELAEAARKAIVPAHLQRRGEARLRALVLDPQTERRLAAQWGGGPLGGGVADPQTALCVRERVQAFLSQERGGVLVSTAALRPLLADFLIRSGIRVDVLAFAEIPPEMGIDPAGVLTLDEGGERRPTALAG